MNPNPDAFEREMSALKQKALPAEWRAEILAAVAQVKPPTRTPRWLLVGWSAAWAAILVMYVTTPGEPDTQTRVSRHAPVLRLDERAALIDSLLASN